MCTSDSIALLLYSLSSTVYILYIFIIFRFLWHVFDYSHKVIQVVALCERHIIARHVAATMHAKSFYSFFIFQKKIPFEEKVLLYYYI